MCGRAEAATEGSCPDPRPSPFTASGQPRQGGTGDRAPKWAATVGVPAQRDDGRRLSFVPSYPNLILLGTLDFSLPPSHPPFTSTLGHHPYRIISLGLVVARNARHPAGQWHPSLACFAVSPCVTTNITKCAVQYISAIHSSQETLSARCPPWGPPRHLVVAVLACSSSYPWACPCPSFSPSALRAQLWPKIVPATGSLTA